MSGMLGGGLGSMGASSQPNQLLQMMQMQKRDPFSRPLPGSGLLGDGGMAAPQMPGMAGQPSGGQPQQGLGQPQTPDMNTISTDFADTQPGLPNLPDNFLGFGFGQYAPKTTQPPQMGLTQSSQGDNSGMRQQMIAQLLQHLMSQGGMPGAGGM